MELDDERIEETKEEINGLYKMDIEEIDLQEEVARARVLGDSGFLYGNSVVPMKTSQVRLWIGSASFACCFIVSSP